MNLAVRKRNSRLRVFSSNPGFPLRGRGKPAPSGHCLCLPRERRGAVPTSWFIQVAVVLFPLEVAPKAKPSEEKSRKPHQPPNTEKGGGGSGRGRCPPCLPLPLTT